MLAAAWQNIKPNFPHRNLEQDYCNIHGVDLKTLQK